jgi:hypothetical protein
MIKPVPYKPLICPTAQVKVRIYGTEPTPRMHAPLTMLEWQTLFTNKTPSWVAYAIGDGLEYGAAVPSRARICAWVSERTPTI